MAEWKYGNHGVEQRAEAGMSRQDKRRHGEKPFTPVHLRCHAVTLRRIVLLGAIVLATAGGVGFWFSGQRGHAAMRRWIGQQLVAVANHYLSPQLSFGELDYHYPRTVVLTNVRLTADDPATPGEHTDILAVDRLTLELAEIPRIGQPIRIQELILDHPELRLISRGTGQSGWLGFSHLLRQGGVSSAAATQGQETLLSSIFEIRLIQINGGLLVIDPRRPAATLMKVDQINAHLDVQSIGASHDQAGWYALDLKLDRVPVLQVHTVGRVNLDTMTLDLSSGHLAMMLGREQDHYLPPELQKLLRDNEVTGRLNVDAHGMVSLGDWQSAHMQLQAHLMDGNIAVASSRWPVQSLDVGWVMADRHGRLDPFNATLLGGKIQATGQVNFTDPIHAGGNVRLDHLRLEQTVRNAAAGSGDYRGDLSGKVAWQAPLNGVFTGSSGGGELAIADGRLDFLPVVGSLLAAVRSAMKVAGIGPSIQHDSAHAVFNFQGDKISFTQLDMDTAWAALRGRGDIGFDQRLDLRFNGGPVERAESVLGGIGRVLGSVTDQLAVYLVTGTVDHPRVDVKIVPALHLP